MFAGGTTGKIISFELAGKLVIAVRDCAKSHAELLDEAMIYPGIDGVVGRKGGAHFEFNDEGRLSIFGDSETLGGGLLSGVEETVCPLLMRARDEFLAMGE